MHKDIPTSKVFYRPIEAAIRWAGLLRYLPMILAAIASPRFLPPSLNCPRWNEAGCTRSVSMTASSTGSCPTARTASRSMIRSCCSRRI